MSTSLRLQTAPPPPMGTRSERTDAQALRVPEHGSEEPPSPEAARPPGLPRDSTGSKTRLSAPRTHRSGPTSVRREQEGQEIPIGPGVVGGSFVGSGLGAMAVWGLSEYLPIISNIDTSTGRWLWRQVKSVPMLMAIMAGAYLGGQLGTWAGLKIDRLGRLGHRTPPAQRP